jgi:hypothetical protein
MLYYNIKIRENNISIPSIYSTILVRIFLDRKTIVFVTGKFSNQNCWIDRWNGNNVRCRFEDGQFHCITNNHILTWK